jgi:hypothetical protein
MLFSILFVIGVNVIITVLFSSHCCFAESESIGIFLMHKYQTRNNLTELLVVLMFANSCVEVNQGWLADSEMNTCIAN